MSTIVTSVAGQFEDRLIARLQARPGLAGVQVDVGPLGDETAREYIQSLGYSTDQEWAGNSPQRNRWERITLTLEVKAEVTGAGAAKIRAARDRVDALINEIKAELVENHKLDGLVGKAQVERVEAPNRGFGSDTRTRAEIREVTVTADAYLTRV